jgi:ATP-dependent exoDNAse (exonuclease V) alpha subunit
MKATKLYSRNINVDVINERELASINNPEKTFRMATIGYSATVEGLKKSCLALEELKLKVGAEVMFIKNDTLGKYVNGTRGIVVGFENSHQAWPIVKTYDNETFIAYPEEWKYEDNSIVRAIITQVPLRLAWAITIHKSQGMTLDAAEIDLGDAFEPGMGYVALSRVRSLNGLKLMNLNEMALKVHPKILSHDKIFKECSLNNVQELNDLSEMEMAACQQKILVERFGGTAIKPVTKRKTRKKKEKPVSSHLITLELLKKNQSLETIVQERGITSSTVFTHI